MAVSFIGVPEYQEKPACHNQLKLSCKVAFNTARQLARNQTHNFTSE